MIGRRGFLGALAGALIAPKLYEPTTSYFFFGEPWKKHGDLHLSERVIADMQDEIFLYMPKASPLVILAEKMREHRILYGTQKPIPYEWLTKPLYLR